MKIPKIPNEVNQEDRNRLEPHLSGVNALNEILVLNTISTEDLLKMLSIEREWGKEHPGYPRKAIGQKLIARVVSRYRDYYRKELNG